MNKLLFYVVWLDRLLLQSFGAKIDLWYQCNVIEVSTSMNTRLDIWVNRLGFWVNFLDFWIIAA